MKKNAYNALYYNAKHNTVTNVQIDKEHEYDYLCELLQCVEIDMLHHVEGFSIIIDGLGFFKQETLISKLNGVEQPIPGNILIAGPLNEEDTLESLDSDITADYVKTLITPYAKIIPNSVEVK